jgi:hypothetical protein
MIKLKMKFHKTNREKKTELTLVNSIYQPATRDIRLG